MTKKNGHLHQLANNYIKELKKVIDNLNLDEVEEAFKMLMKVYKNESRVFVLGNGGAASTASHMACDLGKGTLARVYDNKEKRLRVMSLTDNVSLLTAYANDLAYEDIFVQQLRNLVEKDDLVILLSGSGESNNVIKAAKYAKERGAKTIGLLGFKDGGELSKQVDCAVIIQSTHYGPIEDAHLIFNHILTSWFARAKKEVDGISKTENGSIPFRVD